MLNSASRGAQVAKLKPFVPLFYGTLRLEGKVDGQGSLRTEGVVEDVPEVSCALGSASSLLRFSSLLRHLRCAGMRRPCTMTLGVNSDRTSHVRYHGRMIKSDRINGQPCCTTPYTPEIEAIELTTTDPRASSSRTWRIRTLDPAFWT